MSNHTKQTNNVITVPKQEYFRLKQQAKAYRTLTAKLFELPLRDTVSSVVSDFRATKLYAENFLTDLEDGLRN